MSITAINRRNSFEGESGWLATLKSPAEAANCWWEPAARAPSSLFPVPRRAPPTIRQTVNLLRHVRLSLGKLPLAPANALRLFGQIASIDLRVRHNGNCGCLPERVWFLRGVGCGDDSWINVLHDFLMISLFSSNRYRVGNETPWQRAWRMWDVH